MYYRVNDQIVEGYKMKDTDGSSSCGETPLWIKILLVIVLLLVLGFFIYNYVKKL